MFGVSKRRAAEILAAWGAESGAPVMDVLMPNLFGEHGVPNYNSVVATFCHAHRARASPRAWSTTRSCRCSTSARLADRLLDLAVDPCPGQVVLEGRQTWVSATWLARLATIAADYRIGSAARPLRSVHQGTCSTPTGRPPSPTTSRSTRTPADDPRGRLVEAVKGRGGQAQVFYSTHQPRVHPRPALAPAQGGAVPGAVAAAG